MGEFAQWCACNWGSEISVGISAAMQPQAEAVASGTAPKEGVQTLGADLADAHGLGLWSVCFC